MADKTAEKIDLRLDRLTEHLVSDRRADPDDELLEGREDTEDGDPVGLARRRLDIGQDVSDVTIAASLAQIAARATIRDRWLAAFGSPLGKHLAMRGSDLNTVLHLLMSLAPRQNS